MDFLAVCVEIRVASTGPCCAELCCQEPVHVLKVSLAILLFFVSALLDIGFFRKNP